jgi:phosphomannomutase
MKSGIYPEEINELDAYKIGQAFCEFVKPSEVVIGADVRLSSPALKRAAIKGVTDLGIKVIDIGTISTDMLYFGVANYGYSGGFSITASHNPKEYNGAKFVRKESRPISSDTGLFEIRDIVLKMEVWWRKKIFLQIILPK